VDKLRQCLDAIGPKTCSSDRVEAQVQLAEACRQVGDIIRLNLQRQNYPTAERVLKEALELYRKVEQTCVEGKVQKSTKPGDYCEFFFGDVLQGSNTILFILAEIYEQWRRNV
jgi:hypothetical protein